MPFVMMLLFWLAVAALFTALLGVARFLSVRSLEAAKKEASIANTATEDGPHVRIGPPPEFMRTPEVEPVEEEREAGLVDATTEDVRVRIGPLPEFMRRQEATTVEEATQAGVAGAAAKDFAESSVRFAYLVEAALPSDTTESLRLLREFIKKLEESSGRPENAGEASVPPDLRRTEARRTEED